MLARVNAVALITGASRGIGRGIALELAPCGCDVIINYARNRAAAERTASECLLSAHRRGHTIRAEIFQADIAQAQDRANLVQFAEAQFGGLDALVNNAGVAPQTRADLLQADE